MKVINLFAGPGAGKTTAAFGLVERMKLCGVLAEFVPEFAKEAIYADALMALDSQGWVFANQENRLRNLSRHVDVAVCDSPLVLSTIFGEGKITEAFRRLVMETFASYDNVNVFLERDPRLPFQQAGRIHDFAQSVAVDRRIKEVLAQEGVPCVSFRVGADLPDRILARLVMDRAIAIPEHGREIARKSIALAAKYDQSPRAMSERARQRDPRPKGQPLEAAGLAR